MEGKKKRRGRVSTNETLYKVLDNLAMYESWFVPKNSKLPPNFGRSVRRNYNMAKLAPRWGRIMSINLRAGTVFMRIEETEFIKLEDVDITQ